MTVLLPAPYTEQDITDQLTHWRSELHRAQSPTTQGGHTVKQAWQHLDRWLDEMLEMQARRNRLAGG